MGGKYEFDVKSLYLFLYFSVSLLGKENIYIQNPGCGWPICTAPVGRSHTFKHFKITCLRSNLKNYMVHYSSIVTI